MSRRNFLKTSAFLGAGALLPGGMAASQAPKTSAQSAPTSATGKPIRIHMGGYGPPDTGFSLALKMIGDRLKAKFGSGVDVKYVYNIMDLGYRSEDILWLVEDGVLTVGYQSSSYMTERVHDVGLLDLPFIFPDTETARSAMDGQLGRVVSARIEEQMNYRILGYFENGFRHISNRVRPIHTPADLKGLTIRVLPSKVQARTFELLGADPKIMDLTEAIEAIKNGTLDAQENPFANTVTYGVHKYHKFHTATGHFYLSRPIFLHRASFEAWPPELQSTMRDAVREAVTFQRDAHIREEDEAAAAIRKAGGQIIELTPEEHNLFVAAVRPLYNEVRGQYSKEMLALIGV